MKPHSITNIIYQRILQIAMIFIPSAALMAQEQVGQTFSLPQAIDYAIKNQTDIKNAQLDTEIASSAKVRLRCLQYSYTRRRLLP